VALAKTVGTVGASIHVHPENIAVGVDINPTHHRSVATCVVTAVHLGRTSAVYEVILTNERGKRVCTSRITLALIPAPRAEPAESS
jgi:uncharacterized protein (TIGR00369 family)